MLDELKTFCMDGIAPFFPALDESKLANVKLRLGDHRAVTIEHAEALTAVLHRAKEAAELLRRLPARGQAIHCVLKGTFALFDFIPAILQLAGAPIDRLMVATLGFSKKNITDLHTLVTTGQVRQIAVLCSHYFSAADSDIYQHAAGFCAAHGFPLVAMRTHAKLLLIAAGDHRLVVESSANLRSCHNVEQATLFADPALFEFHAAWMNELIEQGKESPDAPRPQTETREPAQAPRKSRKATAAGVAGKRKRRAADVPRPSGKDRQRGVGKSRRAAGPGEARAARGPGRTRRVRDRLATLG